MTGNIDLLDSQFEGRNFLFADFSSANSLIHKYKIGIKGNFLC